MTTKYILNSNGYGIRRLPARGTISTQMCDHHHPRLALRAKHGPLHLALFLFSLIKQIKTTAVVAATPDGQEFSRHRRNH
jgi:hypothetical protein